MKIRLGFVSNSSSSSFTCDVCGETHSGWDISLEDAGMLECERSHVFCKEHEIAELSVEIQRKQILNYKYSSEELKNQVEKMSDDELEDLISEDPEGEIEEILGDSPTPSDLCPICNFKAISDNDVIKYLLKKANLKKNDLINVFKEEFGDYETLKKYIRE